jgi:hypothetical protein
MKKVVKKKRISRKKFDSSLAINVGMNGRREFCRVINAGDTYSFTPSVDIVVNGRAVKLKFGELRLVTDSGKIDATWTTDRDALMWVLDKAMA